ncbi:hypothetical protein IJG14_08855 [bacterium]|nr:hypothetical protein [bacterium]
MYKKLNIFFFSSILILLLSFVLINFAVDPYAFFIRKKPVADALTRENLFYLNMKTNSKYRDTLIIGTSDVGSTFCVFKSSQKANIIWTKMLHMRDYYDIIQNYLYLHPETKNVYIVLSYPALMKDFKRSFPKFSTKPYSIKEIQESLFSIETFHEIQEIHDNYLYVFYQIFMKLK